MIRRSSPKKGADGERAMSNAERKLAKGRKPPKNAKGELPGVTIRRGRKEGA